MNQPDDVVLVNPFRRLARTFLGLAAIFLVVAAAAGLALLHPAVQPKRPPGPLVLTLAIVIMLGLCFFVSMALAALFTWPALRRAERMLSEFREGRYLVRWDYSPEEWEAYVASLERDVNKINWWVAAVILVPLWIAAIAGAWTLNRTLSAKIGWSLLLVVVSLIVAGSIAGGVRYFRGRRCRRLREATPRAFIGSQAVYCAGDFNFWGTAMRELQSVRRLPGPPPVLEIIIGMSQRAKTASTAVTLATAVSGHPAHMASYAMRHLVPIPTSAEADAERLVCELAVRAG
jgi:hypothetical protein